MAASLASSGAAGNGTTAAGPSSSSSSTAATAPVDKLPISSDLLSKLKPAKIFTAEVTKGTNVTSLAFDDLGHRCLSSGEDGYLHLYDARKGTHSLKVPSLKYGAHLGRFTHASDAVIFASTKENNAIRYLDLNTRTFLGYFEGHNNKVVSLEMSPKDDSFLSASVDEAVVLWDLRSRKQQGRMELQGHPVVAYDPTGMVAAVAVNERAAVLLYDVRKIDQLPFLVIYLDDREALSRISMPPRIPIITSLVFDSKGEFLLIGTSGDVHYVYDTLGSDCTAPVARLVGHSGLERASGGSIGMVAEAGISGQEFCWTPDGKWVMAGGADGTVSCWHVDPQATQRNEFRNLQPKFKLPGHDGPCRSLAFNPRYAQLTSAGAEVAFWLPELPEQI
ncbi:WD40 repeat-like protein [Testicularia cyperi]|uniref:WD40 repeat-like protein n=1 Tax=Testicularia cyperi TaxID=1882483 RepID=A0A317XWH8_9BASI|nr:WD40 repeat-like protein [Testicularia cyperi]